MPGSPQSSLKNLAATVCLLIVVSSAAALFSIHSSSLNHTHSLQRFDEFKEAINSARVAQVSFKTQVQEWKNILLRGQDPRDYDDYLKRFTENEGAVDRELDGLAELMLTLQLDPEDVKKLQAEHAALGKSYRAALGNYRRGDVSSVLAVDRSVRGMDRKMNEEIDALVFKIDAKGDSFLASFSEDAKHDEAFFRRLLLGLAILTCVVTFTFIFKALSAGKKQG